MMVKMEKIERKETRWPMFLLVGCLSMVSAEVFAGSSQLWFIDPWSLIVTFWLYFGHLLLFLNLAMRTKRTSLPQLYLWGTIIALYESWITKVLWWGYPGSEGPAIALVGGIAILEFSTLVFFWHPVLAFVVPILIFETFAVSQDSPLPLDQKAFASHLNFLKTQNKNAKYFFYFLPVLGAAFLSMNAQYNLMVVGGAVLGSVLLIYLFLRLSTKKNPNSFSIRSLRLGKKGFTIVWIYIGLLYLLTFFIILPERLPKSIFPYLIIVGFYVFIAVLLRVSKPIEEEEIAKGMANLRKEELFSTKFIFKIYGLFLLLSVVFCIVGVAGFLITFALFLGLFLLGPIFFVFIVRAAFKKKK